MVPTWMRFGDPEIPGWIWNLIQVSTFDCWIWIGSHSPQGYAVIDGKGGHRVFLSRALGGGFNQALHVDHLCEVRACVNPAHLEQVTPKEHWRRGKERIGNRRRDETLAQLYRERLRAAFVILDGAILDGAKQKRPRKLRERFERFDYPRRRRGRPKRVEPPSPRRASDPWKEVERRWRYYYLSGADRRRSARNARRRRKP